MAVSDGNDTPADSSAAAIAAEYEQLRAQLPVALVEVGFPSARVEYLNATAQALLGYDEDDVRGGLDGLRLLDTEGQSRILKIASEQLAETVALGLPYRRHKGQQVFEFTGVRKDGSAFPAEVQSAYILDRAGCPKGVRLVFWDLTERRQREAERRQFELQLRQSQKVESLGQLAGGIAHDFNNLLTVVLGDLYLLRAELVDRDDALEIVDEATRAAETGADLVRRMLDFARAEIETWEPVDLSELVRETVRLATPLLTSSVKLTLRAPDDAQVVLGNRTALKQVLLNLLVNARDAIAGAGTIAVSLRSMMLGDGNRWTPSDLPHGPYHVITVQDGGHGIPAEIQERIFDPFFSTKDPGRGTGLGLTIGLTVARSHHGWLSVDSAVGEGATFRLFLPASANLDAA